MAAVDTYDRMNLIDVVGDRFDDVEDLEPDRGPGCQVASAVPGVAARHRDTRYGRFDIQNMCLEEVVVQQSRPVEEVAAAGDAVDESSQTPAPPCAHNYALHSVVVGTKAAAGDVVGIDESS